MDWDISWMLNHKASDLANVLLYFSFIEMYCKCHKRGRKACSTSSWLNCDMQGKV